MPGIKRPSARIIGHLKASEAAAKAGLEVKAGRKRRGMHQESLAAKIGISQARQADLEAGRGGGAPLEVWFALGEALGRPFRAEFLRDRLEEPADAWHLAIQELVLKLGRRQDSRVDSSCRPARLIPRGRTMPRFWIAVAAG